MIAYYSIFPHCDSVEIPEIYSHTFLAKIPSKQRFTKESTVWKNAIKCDHDFCAKINIFFRQINMFTKEVTKELISRKIFERDHVF